MTHIQIITIDTYFLLSLCVRHSPKCFIHTFCDLILRAILSGTMSLPIFVDEETEVWRGAVTAQNHIVNFSVRAKHPWSEDFSWHWSFAVSWWVLSLVPSLSPKSVLPLNNRTDSSMWFTEAFCYLKVKSSFKIHLHHISWWCVAAWIV